MTGSSGDATAIAPDGSGGVRGSRIAMAGFLFAALFVTGWLLVRDSPLSDATDSQLLAYFGDPDNRLRSTIAGLYVIPFACIAFIWFVAALRDRYLRNATRENTILSTAHLVSGALVVTSLFALAAVELAVVWLAEAGRSGGTDGQRALLAFGEAMSSIMALRSAAVFVGVSSSRAVRTGLFPRAYGVASMLTAVALLVLYQSAPWVTLLFPAWVAASSVLILIRRHARDLADGA